MLTTLAGLKGQTVAINAPDNILFLLTAVSTGPVGTVDAARLRRVVDVIGKR